MLLATALALLITGCAHRRLLFKNKLAAVAPKETITHHFCRNWAEENWVDAAKICGAEKMLLKQKPTKNKWI